jgi:hypothetical protein
MLQGLKLRTLLWLPSKLPSLPLSSVKKTIGIFFRAPSKYLIAQNLPTRGWIRFLKAYSWQASGLHHLFKGTVSPDNGLYFIFCEIKSVLSAGLQFYIFLLRSSVPEIFRSFVKTALWKYVLNNFSDFPKAVPESMFPLTDTYWKSIDGFLKAACVLLIKFPKAAS